MKATLDERGVLVVSSETPVESFALSHWFDLWAQRRACFQVTTVTIDGETKLSDVIDTSPDASR